MVVYVHIIYYNFFFHLFFFAIFSAFKLKSARGGGGKTVSRGPFCPAGLVPLCFIGLTPFALARPRELTNTPARRRRRTQSQGGLIAAGAGHRKEGGGSFVHKPTPSGPLKLLQFFFYCVYYRILVVFQQGFDLVTARTHETAVSRKVIFSFFSFFFFVFGADIITFASSSLHD